MVSKAKGSLFYERAVQSEEDGFLDCAISNYEKALLEFIHALNINPFDSLLLKNCAVCKIKIEILEKRINDQQKKSIDVNDKKALFRERKKSKIYLKI